MSLFVVTKLENPYIASRLGLEVNPLGVYPLGPRSLPAVLLMVHHRPESLYLPTKVNTLQVDGLGRIPGLRKPYT